MAYLNPKFLIVDFLRRRLTDPRDRAETSKTESFTATASQTEFSLTPTTDSKLSTITSITDNTTAVTKWQDYYIDFRSQKVVFFTGRTAGHTISIIYKEGTTNWIYWDKPDETLSKTAFPRIDVIVVSGSGKRLGQYEAEVESNIHFQIDVWTKEKQNDQIFTIDSVKYTGEALSEYLAYKVLEALEDYESDLFPALYGYTPVGIPRSMPFNESLQCHHKTVEFIINGLEIGRIS